MVLAHIMVQDHGPGPYGHKSRPKPQKSRQTDMSSKNAAQATDRGKKNTPVSSA